MSGIPENARCCTCQYYGENLMGFLRAEHGRNAPVSVPDCNNEERDDDVLPYEEVCEHYEYDPEDDRSAEVNYPNEPGRTLEIAPDVVCDFRKLPFNDDTFYHVVFDPPHLTRNGHNSRMGRIYGTLPKIGWEDIIRDGFRECMRVLKPCGTLIFKWSESDIPVRRVIAVIGAAPLYGHHSGKTAKTHWLCFVKGVSNIYDFGGTNQ